MAMEQNYKFRPLSDVGGLFELPGPARKILCLMDNKHLYIAKDSEFDFWTLFFQERLRRAGFEYIAVFKTRNEIEQAYSKKQAHSYKNNSARQEEVVHLVEEAVQQRASDIHVIVDDRKTQIKFRVDGSLKQVSELSEQDGNDLCATIYQTMCDVAEPVFNPRRSQDAHLLTEMIPKLNLYGGRIATRPTDRGLLMVIRLLYDRLGEETTLEKLGYLPEQIEMIERMRSHRYGINILSGPTGSGKSTTLECVMRSLIAEKQGKSHVLTIEDPPEYRIDGAVQTPIMCDKEDDAAVSQEWAHSIGNVMRLDPDVLMSGEIRDVASASATFRAAMTGHSVWTTLHANDALSVLIRLQDIGVSMGLLTDSTLVTGLTNQVLVRQLCRHCKIPYLQGQDAISEPVHNRIKKFCKTDDLFLRGAGCDACHQTGIKGRTVVAEVIEPTTELMQIYVKESKNVARKFWLNELHGKSKNQVLIEKINTGSIDPRDGEEDVCRLDADLQM